MGRMKELYTKLPENVLENIEGFRNYYKILKEAKDDVTRAEVYERIGGYVLGLKDAGIVTEVERNYLRYYMIGREE